MKKHCFTYLLFFFITCATNAQDSIHCSYFVGKKRIYFNVENTSSDTLRLSWRTLYFDFREYPVPQKDYWISRDSFFVNVADFRAVAERVSVQDDLQRRRLVSVLPGESFGFHMKIPKARKIAHQNIHMILLFDGNTPPVKCVRLKKNTITVTKASDFIIELN